MSSLLKPVKSEPMSLLASPTIKKSGIVKVYFQHQSLLYKVNIEAEGLTTNQVIQRAIEQLNETKELSLLSEPCHYELFAARKDGSKDNGLPALEPNQHILKTQIKRFHLVAMLKVQSFYAPLLSLPTKDTISSIKSEITIENSKSKQQNFDEASLYAKPKFNFCGFFCVNQ